MMDLTIVFIHLYSIIYLSFLHIDTIVIYILYLLHKLVFVLHKHEIFTTEH
jgi:hypothetical protein